MNTNTIIKDGDDNLKGVLSDGDNVCDELKMTDVDKILNELEINDMDGILDDIKLSDDDFKLQQPIINSLFGMFFINHHLGNCFNFIMFFIHF